MAKPQSLLAKKKVKKQGTHVFRRWQHDRFKCVKVRKQGPRVVVSVLSELGDARGGLV